MRTCESHRLKLVGNPRIPAADRVFGRDRQIVIYRPSIGPDSLRDALRATFVGDWEEPSGESRLKLSITLHAETAEAIQ